MTYECSITQSLTKVTFFLGHPVQASNMVMKVIGKVCMPGLYLWRLYSEIVRGSFGSLIHEYHQHNLTFSSMNVVVGLVNIFKSEWEWSHMRDFLYIKCCAKGFYSQISILDNKWLLKIAKKWENAFFSSMGWNWREF